MTSENIANVLSIFRSISCVEPYLQLAHSYLGLNELKKSEEYLALARWIVLNAEVNISSLFILISGII
jgi:hypothetical protein